MKQDPGQVFDGVMVTVLGAGESGQAAARWLKAAGALVIVSDSRPESEWDRKFLLWCRQAGVSVEAGGHTPDSCTRCAMMVVSPGISALAAPVRMAIDSGVAVVSDLVLAACFWNGKIVAVTGTNGKTTTTMLIEHLLTNAGIPAVAAGNISPPLFQVMDQNRSDTVAVLEVSSFQLELLRQQWRLPFDRPHVSVAIWLNLAPDHLDRHGDMKTYAECKACLLELQDSDAWAVINRDDSVLEPYSRHGNGKRFFFTANAVSDSPGAYIDQQAGRLVLNGLDKQGTCLVPEVYDLSGWGLVGAHNLENLAAAVVAARLMGASKDDIQRGIATFGAPAHRFETVVVAEGVTYIDDSKATNAAATIRALEACRSPVVLVAGGLGKDEDYEDLSHIIGRLAQCGMIRAVILVGVHGPRLARSLEGEAVRGIAVEIVSQTDDGQAAMDQAVSLALRYAIPGDVVLLSPACASFDMFSSYRERGRAFRRSVQEIACKMALKKSDNPSVTGHDQYLSCT